MKLLKIILIVVILSLSFACGKSNKGVGSTVAKTPRGVKLIGVNPSATMKRAIDQGIDLVNVRIKCSNYKPVKHTDITLEIRPSIKYKGKDVYKVPTHPSYKGSPFDKNGFMYISGQYDPSKNILILPNSPTAIETKDTVGFEVEHMVLKDQDPFRYKATLIHNANNVHPIITCK